MFGISPNLSFLLKGTAAFPRDGGERAVRVLPERNAESCPSRAAPGRCPLPDVSAQLQRHLQTGRGRQGRIK